MKNLITFMLSCLLVACGGSPGSSSLSEPLVISGTVAKGLMKQAKVEIYGVNSDGSLKSTPFVSTTTNGSSNPGYYSVVVPSYTGVLVVKASMTPNTTMLDEETRTEFSPSSALVMRTALVVQSGQLLKVNVNPFTESAVAEVEAETTKFTSAAVRQANHQQAQALSVDPVSSDSSFDISDRTKPASPLALHLAALSKIAQDSSARTALGCVSASTNASKIDCVVGAIRNKKHLATALRQSLNNALDSVRTDRQLNHIAAVVQAPTNIMVDTVNRTPVQRLKNFVATLRSNAKSIDSTDNSLITHYEVLQSEVESRTAPATGSSWEALELALKGVDLWLATKTDQSIPFLATTVFPSIWSGVSPANCIFFQDTNYTTQATAVSNANFLECRTSPRREDLTDSNGYFKTCLASTTDTSAANWCYQLWATRLRIRPDVTVSNTFKVQSITGLRKYINYQGTGMSVYKEPVNAGVYVGRTTYGAYSPDYESTIVYTRDTENNYTQASLTGYFATGFKAVTQTNTSTYFSNPSTSPCGYSWCYKPTRYEVLGDKHQVTLNTALTGGYSSPGPKKLNLAGSINLVKNGFLESQLELANTSYVSFELDSSNQLISGSEEVSLALKISSPTGYLSGNLMANKFAANAGGVDSSPTQVIFTGSMGLGTTEFLGLTLTAKDLNRSKFNPLLPLSAANYKLGTLSIQSAVTIPNRPTLNLSLLGTFKETQVSSGYFNLQYSQGTLVVNIMGARDGIETTADQLTFQTTDGISMTLTDNKASLVDIYFQGHKVGQWDNGRTMLLYADGSFEQF